MRESRIRLAIFSAMALSAAATARVQQIMDEDDNVIATVHDTTGPTMNVPHDFRDYIPAKERTYDPRPQANLNKLRGRNFKSKIKGQGRRPF